MDPSSTAVIGPSSMIRCAVFVCPCRLPLIARASARRQRFLSAGISAMSKQEQAAEIIREAVDAKVVTFADTIGFVTRMSIDFATPGCRCFRAACRASSLNRHHETQHQDDNQLHQTQLSVQVGKSGANLEGTPEEVAERLVKEEGGEELKQRELEKKGAHQIPGVAGSGIERGEAAAVAQVSATLHAVGGPHRSIGLHC